MLSRVDIQRKQSLSGILASSEAMEMFVDVDLSSKRTRSGFDLLANQKIMNNMNIHIITPMNRRHSSLRLKTTISP
jgi:hypothetical protein